MQLVEVGGELYWSGPGSAGRIWTANASLSGILTGSVVLAAPVRSFAVAGGTLYWTDGLTIYKLPVPAGSIDAGPAGAPLFAPGNNVSWLLADPGSGGNLYWTTDSPSAVNRGPKGGGLSSVISPVATSDVISQLLVDGSNLYWFESAEGCASAQLVRMPILGSMPAAVASLSAGCALAVAQDAANLFWIGQSDGAIYRWVK
jgi:hypothetical protein